MEQMKDLWHFWNYNFLARQFSSRPIKKHKTRPYTMNLPYKCFQCGGTFKGKRYKTGKHDTNKYRCPKCYGIQIKQELADARSGEARKSIAKAKEFEELLADCRTKGTCDILAAHHEAFKDDPNRLKTDFLVNLICGAEGAEKYMKTKVTTEAQA